MEQNQTTNSRLIPIAIIVAGGLIAIAIYFGGSSSAPVANIPNTQDQTVFNVAPITNEDHLLGNRNASLIIVEYSDTECPWCKVFHNTMKEVLNAYDGQVAWVYRHLPYHSLAPKEAEATECANELGGNQAFWKYVDELYEVTNSNDSLDPSELPKIASTVGLDVGAFNTCLSSGKYSESVKKYVDEASQARLGTPYSVIVAKDGRQVIINGAEPIAGVRSKIDALLE